MFLKQYEFLFLWMAMKKCPLCGFKLKKDYGFVSCRSCGWSACGQ